MGKYAAKPGQYGDTPVAQDDVAPLLTCPNAFDRTQRPLTVIARFLSSCGRLRDLEGPRM